MIDVTDDGRGIPEADQQHIFNEFARGEAEGGGGLGLGLFIVQRLASELELDVALSVPEGGGSCFTLGPLQCGTLGEGAEASETPTDGAPRGRVLIVDDDSETLDATRTILTGWGWEVDVRRVLDQDDIATLEPPVLVISDFELGAGRTGLDVVAALRAIYGPVPALIVSGSSAPEVTTAVREADLILLQKPVRPVQLRSAILGVLN